MLKIEKLRQICPIVCMNYRAEHVASAKAHRLFGNEYTRKFRQQFNSWFL